MTRTNAAVWTVIMFAQMCFGIILMTRGEPLALLSVVVGALGFISCGMATTTEEEKEDG